MITQNSLIQIISWLSNTPIQRICLSTSIKEDLNLDSIDYLDLIVRLERSLDITFTDAEIESIDTVQDLNNFLKKRSLAPLVVSKN